MPYITQSAREAILEGRRPPLNEGELNFSITAVLHEWLETVGVSYANLNAAIGVLECAKLELYRRIASPYEELAIERNGDIEILKKGD